VTRETDLRQRPDFDYGERLEADYLTEDRRLAQNDRDDRHKGYGQRRGPDGYRAFPAPPSGFRLVWEHGAEPRLERVS
jgi:hypothetical protein